jgi:serine/threonine-protein kinase
VSNDGPPSDEADSFLKEVAHAPTVTLPSVQRGSDGEDPEKLAHFTVLGRIGAGGMGIVYRAKDEKLGRIVALKVLPREFEADEVRRKRFMREARAAAALTHPNIVTVYEIGESLGRVFIAMELVDGRRLRALMNRGPMPVAEALRLMLEIVAGVAKAHAAGVVHRDLKPENTLVTPDSHVKLLDFGLAKQLSAEELVVTRTGEGTILGTPGYMSPEQMQGRPATPAADVFALGVILYELLTERRPFKGKTVPQLVCSIDKDVPSAPSRLNPRVPGALDEIVARCLSKDPGDRYPDARALLEELSSVTPPPPSAVVRRSRRRAVMVGVGALALGIAAAVVAHLALKVIRLLFS